MGLPRTASGDFEAGKWSAGQKEASSDPNIGRGRDARGQGECMSDATRVRGYD
jgi:hypothetical protein